MIYIDQPIGTGFSYGKDTVNSTEAAAPFVWTAFQVLFESGEFSKFQSREYVLLLTPVHPAAIVAYLTKRPGSFSRRRVMEAIMGLRS